jgi:acetoacetyl-CoA synthetase
VPARIAQVEVLPVTLTASTEAGARDAVNDRPVRNLDALQNPECLDAIAKHPVLQALPAIRAGAGAVG